MTREKERENREELFRLMQEHPELPILPIVDGCIIADEGGYWLGAWGSAQVDEYVIAERSGRILFKGDGDVFCTLEEYLGYDEFEALPEKESECRSRYDSLPWIKAIVVFINLPE